jgi:hypothetical protein
VASSPVSLLPTAATLEALSSLPIQFEFECISSLRHREIHQSNQHHGRRRPRKRT